MDSVLGITNPPSSFTSHLSNTPSAGQWLVSPDPGLNTDTPTNIPFESKPQTVRLRPTTHEGTTTNINNDITPVQDGKNGVGNGLIGDVSSRADVFAGVIIFSVGMLALIAAMIFYFVNGRSWRAIKGQPGALEAGIEAKDPEEKGQCSDVNVSTSVAVNDAQHPNDVETTDPELSPSTARLENPPAKSVFAFFKGAQRQSIDGNTDPLISAMNMPALTRTKARSSVKRKSGSIMQPRPIIAEAPQSHISINIQEPELAFNPISTNSSSSVTSSDSTGTPRLARKQQRPDIATPSKTPVRSGRSTIPTLLRLDMPPHANPSIIGLYGSAKSSPNGSLADAASVQAIYCHSLRSAMSYTTHAESTLGLDYPDSESKEVVLATADMGRQRD